MWRQLQKLLQNGRTEQIEIQDLRHSWLGDATKTARLRFDRFSPSSVNQTSRPQGR